MALTPSPTDNPDVIYATEDNCSPVLVCNYTTYIESRSYNIGVNYPVWKKNGMGETILGEGSPDNKAISKLKIIVTSSASYTCIIYVSDVNGRVSRIESHAYWVYPFVPSITSVNVLGVDTTSVNVTWDDGGNACSFCTAETVVNISLVAGNWTHSFKTGYSEGSVFIDNLTANTNYTVMVWNVVTCDGQNFTSAAETIEFKTNSTEPKPSEPTKEGSNIGWIPGVVVAAVVVAVLTFAVILITILVVCYICKDRPWIRNCWRSFKTCRQKPIPKGTEVYKPPVCSPNGPDVYETQEQGQLLSDLCTPETATGGNSDSTEQYPPKETVLYVPPLNYKPDEVGEERETQQSFSTRPLNNIPSDKQREEESLHSPQPKKRDNTTTYFVNEHDPRVLTDKQPDCSSVSVDETPSGTAEQYVSGTDPD